MDKSKQKWVKRGGKIFLWVQIYKLVAVLFVTYVHIQER